MTLLSSCLEHLEHSIHPWVYKIITPKFNHSYISRSLSPGHVHLEHQWNASHGNALDLACLCSSMGVHYRWGGVDSWMVGWWILGWWLLNIGRILEAKKDPQTKWRIFVFHTSLISSISTTKMPFPFQNITRCLQAIIRLYNSPSGFWSWFWPNLGNQLQTEYIYVNIPINHDVFGWLPSSQFIQVKRLQVKGLASWMFSRRRLNNEATMIKDD